MQSASSTAHGQVLADLLPGERSRDILLVFGFAALVGVAAQIAVPLPFTPVPITGQTFAVLLGAAALGATRGASGMALYLALGVAGVPWFAPGNGASFGYIIGFVLAAAVVGLLAERGADRSFLRIAAAMALGNVLIYAVGVPYLMAAADLDLRTGFTAGVWPFLPGDALKLALAATLVPGAWRLTRGDRT